MGFGFGAAPRGAGKWAQCFFLSETLCCSAIILCSSALLRQEKEQSKGWSGAMERLEMGLGFGVVPHDAGNGTQWSFLFGALHSFWWFLVLLGQKKDCGRGQKGQWALSCALEIRAQPHGLAKIPPPCKRWGAKQQAVSKPELFSAAVVAVIPYLLPGHFGPANTCICSKKGRILVDFFLRSPTLTHLLLLCRTQILRRKRHRFLLPCFFQRAEIPLCIERIEGALGHHPPPRGEAWTHRCV